MRDNKETGLVAGMLVHTDKGLVPIERIQCGDMVLSKQEDEGGEKSYKRVSKTFRHDDKPLWVIFAICIESSEIECIVSTCNHRFWVEGTGWTAAKMIQTNRNLQYKDANHECFVLSSEPLYQTGDGNNAWMFVDSSINAGVLINFKDGEVDSKYSEWFLSSGRSEYLPVCSQVGFIDEDYCATVYDIEIEDCNAYYVGQQGIWVMSSKSGCGV